MACSRHDSIGHYFLESKIGLGSSASVFLAENYLVEEKVAVKVFGKKSLTVDQVTDLEREMEILELLPHKHILFLYDVIDADDCFFMITEHCPLGDIAKDLRRNNNVPYSEARARKLFIQLLSAVEFCHSKQVMHRDIKLENLLLRSNEDLVLSDFGLSCILDMKDGSLTVPVGSPAYCAPELLKAASVISRSGSGSDGFGNADRSMTTAAESNERVSYSFPVDIYAMGVCLYAMLSGGDLPYRGEDNVAIYENIMSNRINYSSLWSSDAISLLKRMLDINADTRATISEIKEHLFVRKEKVPLSMNLLWAMDVLDDDALQMAAELLGRDELDVEEAVLAKTASKMSATYWLLVHKNAKGEKVPKIALS